MLLLLTLFYFLNALCAVVGGLAPPAAEDEERQQIEAQHQVIFVLESAQLEVAQVGKVRRLCT